MTATRRAATIAGLTLVWLACAALLWRTQVPGDLTLAELDEDRYFSAAELRRAERYESLLRVIFLAGTAAQLLVVTVCAVFAPRIVARLRGGPLARGFQLAFVTFLSLWLVRVGFGLWALGWRRRYGVAREGYLDFVLRPWSTVLAELLLGCVAVVLLMLLARRLGPSWWIAGAGIVAALGCAYVVLQPLVLTPRFAPVEDPALRARVEALAEGMGAGNIQVRLRKAGERTRAVNAEVVGIGPTQRVVLWDTLLEGPFTPAEVDALTAHELAHVTRRHVWKGLGWFLLAVLPCIWLVDRAARLRGGLGRPEAVPAAIAAALALQLALAPAISLATRRYEAEADWVALEATRDPAAMSGMLRRLASTNLTDPEPPRAWSIAFRTHPSIMRRLAMASAWANLEGERLPPPTAP